MSRKIIGFLLLLAGLAVILSDVHVAYINRGAAHVVNAMIGVLLVFAGGYVMQPTVADAIASAIVKRIPAIADAWPGGSRRYDPPPAPDVPLPPSVTSAREPEAEG